MQSEFFLSVLKEAGNVLNKTVRTNWCMQGSSAEKVAVMNTWTHMIVSEVHLSLRSCHITYRDLQAMCLQAVMVSILTSQKLSGSQSGRKEKHEPRDSAHSSTTRRLSHKQRE